MAGTGRGWIYVNFLGQRTDVNFNAGWADAVRTSTRMAYPDAPPLDNETVEWNCLLSGVLEAKDQFVMFEAGAGYGRWLVSAACALRVRRPELSWLLIGAEAEPLHFDWLHKHFRDNDIDPDAHRLFKGALAAKNGSTKFVVGEDHPAAWYGQAMLDHSGQAEALWPTEMLIVVETRSMETLLDDVDRVDVFDCDIQGAEREVIPAAIAILNRKVKRAFVGTHFMPFKNCYEIDDIVCDVFSSNGWRCIEHHRPNTTEQIGSKSVHFDDGAQYWINPRLM